MVVDLDDPRLALYRCVRDPELLQRHGVFVAEGRLVVRRLLTASRFAARSVLVTPAARRDLADVLDSPGRDLSVSVADADLFHALTGFHVHRGCLAIGERPVRPPDWRDAVASAQTVVVLEQVGNPDNVGGVFRNAAALGADAVLLSPGCADPLYRKSIRTSMAATLTVPFAPAEPWPAVVDDLRASGFSVVALTPAADARDIAELAASPRPSRVALLLGHEGSGVSHPAAAHADHHVRVPMTPGADSLNVASAAAIALHTFSEYRIQNTESRRRRSDDADSSMNPTF